MRLRAIADPLSETTWEHDHRREQTRCRRSDRGDAVSKSPKDGSVLLLTSSTFLTTAATQPKVSYDPIVGFASVAMVAQGPLLLAVFGMPLRSRLRRSLPRRR